MSAVMGSKTVTRRASIVVATTIDARLVTVLDPITADIHAYTRLVSAVVAVFDDTRRTAPIAVGCIAIIADFVIIGVDNAVTAEAGLIRPASAVTALSTPIMTKSAMMAMQPTAMGAVRRVSSKTATTALTSRVYA